MRFGPCCSQPSSLVCSKHPGVFQGEQQLDFGVESWYGCCVQVVLMPCSPRDSCSFHVFIVFGVWGVLRGLGPLLHPVKLSFSSREIESCCLQSQVTVSRLTPWGVCKGHTRGCAVLEVERFPITLLHGALDVAFLT